MTSDPLKPYGSARDLPSVQDMERQLAAFKALKFLLPKDQREELRRLEREHQRITSIVDRFYGLLGARNWIFTGDLNLDAIERVIETDDSHVAESRLIDYYQGEGRIAHPLRRLHRFEAMRARHQLLTKALDDYSAGRHYSTVLVLLAVMDGFVNDIDKQARKGLHSRSAEEMVAWDSVVGHHLGLSHAHQSFTKSVFKTDTREAHELWRNGIMHGTVVNFDNAVISTKAWNRLFAVTDWADSKERQNVPGDPTPTLRESVTRWSAIQEQKARIDAWQPREHDGSDAGCAVAEACRDFLERWQRRQWGPLGEHFMETGPTRSSRGTVARRAKDLYQSLDLSEWTVRKVRHVAAAVAQVDTDLTVNGVPHRTSLRWVHTDDTGSTATEWEPGRWTLSQYGPTLFLSVDTATDGSADADD